MSTSGFRVASWAPIVVLAALFATDCTSDHGALAARPHAAGAAGKAGAGGMAGAAGRPHGGGSAQGGTGGSATPPDKHMETPGRSVLTVMHGIVDADRVVWCFARVRNGSTTLVGDPVPEGGLAYGQSVSFEELPHIDSEKDGVVPYVITGELALIDGLDCEAAVARAEAARTFPALGPAPVLSAAGGQGGEGGQAGESAAGGQSGDGNGAGQGGKGGTGPGAAGGDNAQAGAGSGEPPPLRVGALPGLPEGTLAEGYSVLEVADGCFGAPAFTHDREQDVCGEDYTPATGSLTAEIAILGRATTTGALAVQALHASRGSGGLGVRASPPKDAVQAWVTLVDNFTEGALKPTDPKRDVASEAYGTDQRLWTVDITVNQSPVYSELWRTVKARAGIDALEDGRGYTLVVLGPSYDVAPKGFWNPPAFGLVDNDPSVE